MERRPRQGPRLAGRPAGTASQAARVLALYRELVEGTEALFVPDLVARHQITERTLRRDLAVIRRVLGPGWEVGCPAESRYQVVVRRKP